MSDQRELKEPEIASQPTPPTVDLDDASEAAEPTVSEIITVELIEITPEIALSPRTRINLAREGRQIE